MSFFRLSWFFVDDDEYHHEGVAMRAARRNRTNENDDGSTSAIHILMTVCWDPQMMATRFSKRIASAGGEYGAIGWYRAVEFVGREFSGVENSSWSPNTLVDPSLCVLSCSAFGHFWMVDNGFRRFRGDEGPCGIRRADWDLTFVWNDAKASGTERNIWLRCSI